MKEKHETQKPAPCPFCKSNETTIEQQADEDQPYFVRCSGCRADGPTVDVRATMEQAAIALWNKRAISTGERGAIIARNKRATLTRIR